MQKDAVLTALNLSLWADAAGPYRPSVPLGDIVHADVAVVGAGLNGLSTAWHLRQREPGKRVVVLEQDIVGGGASGRNAGFVMPEIGFSLPYLRRLYGRTRTLDAHDYAMRALDYARHLVTEHSMDSDAVLESSVLYLAMAERWLPELERRRTFFDEVGLNEGVQWLDEESLEQEVNSPLARTAGILNTNMMLINPCKHVRELKRLAVASGVEVYERSPVIGAHDRGRDLELVTPQGRVAARHVVVATNAHSHLLPQTLAKRREQMPLYAYGLATEPLSDADWDTLNWKHRGGIEDPLSLFHWFRPTIDGRIVFGGRVWAIGGGSGLAKDYSERAFRISQSDLVSFFPALSDVKITHRWGGVMSATVDLLPRLGFADDCRRVFRISGCWGHGVGLAHLNGLVAADVISERDTELTSFWLVDRKGVSWPPAGLAELGVRTAAGLFQLIDNWNIKRARPMAGDPAQKQALESLWLGSTYA